jgi:hypothetical protein
MVVEKEERINLIDGSRGQCTLSAQVSNVFTDRGMDFFDLSFFHKFAQSGA